VTSALCWGNGTFQAAKGNPLPTGSGPSAQWGTGFPANSRVQILAPPLALSVTVDKLLGLLFLTHKRGLIMAPLLSGCFEDEMGHTLYLTVDV
jgi:hypothetical protein